MKKVYAAIIFYVLTVFVLSVLSISILSAAGQGALDGNNLPREMVEKGKNGDTKSFCSATANSPRSHASCTDSTALVLRLPNVDKIMFEK